MSRHPVIVLEGPDGVGKTTLAEALCDHLGGRYMHLTYRFRDKMHCYHGAALKHALLLAERQPVVVDRWWPSEIVYADAYRGGSRWPLMYRHLHRVGLRHGMSYVFCLPQDRARYLAHFDRLKGERAEMYDAGMHRVYDGFEARFMDMVSDDVPALSRYDMFEEGHDMQAVVQKVLESSEDERAMLPDWAKDVRHKNFSGSPHRAKFLVVGDLLPARNHLGNWADHGPFVNYLENDGLRWSEALERSDVPEPDLCYVNCFEQDPAVTERVIRECARTTQVVTLGSLATNYVIDELKLLNVTPVRHPSEWGQFRRDDYLYIHGVFK